MKGAKTDFGQFRYFRHVLVRRVWELALGCDLHRRVLEEFFPSRSTKALTQMKRDPGGHARIAMQDAFQAMGLDCPDGCSLALSLMIEDLNRVKDDLCKTHDGLAYFFAMKYQKMGTKLGFELEDLVQHGRIGLAEGIERFRPEKGFAFSTYGTWWVRHAISRALKNGSLVRVPVHKQDKEGMPPPVLSLDMKIDDGEHSHTFLELIEDEAVHDQVTVHYDIQEMLHQLAKLSPKAQDVLRMRFGLHPYVEPHTLREIGEKYGVSRERVRQLQNQYLEMLKSRMAA